MENKAVVICSGGLDSTTLLYYTMKRRHVIPLVISFNYGQAHKKELNCIKSMCKKLKLEHIVVNLTSLGKLLKSSLTQETIETPQTHYTHQTQQITVVPYRNSWMLLIAAGIARSRNIYTVYFGPHKNDYTTYPDCRPEYVKELNKLLEVADYKKVKVEAPFINLTKTQIVKIGYELGVPFERTYSCYLGGKKPCSRCGTCQERIEAFEKNGLKDPLYSTKKWHEITKKSTGRLDIKN